MTKKLYLPFLMAMIVALMTSCSKKMGELSSDYFTVTPQVLEAVGGKVPATINGKFPEKYFNKKAVVEVTPVLKWNGGEAKGQSAVFQGEKVEGNDQTCLLQDGRQLHYEDIFRLCTGNGQIRTVSGIQGYSRQKDCHYPCCKSS